MKVGISGTHGTGKTTLAGALCARWYLPTNGDSRDIVGAGERSPDTVPAITDFRAPTVDYLGQVARSAEQLGYEAVLTPTGTWCEDAWIFTAALSQLAGYGLVRGGAGTALVGSHAEVADRIEEYHALGIDHFILSGQPHLEEAYYFAEGAAAELRTRGLLTASAA